MSTELLGGFFSPPNPLNQGGVLPGPPLFGHVPPLPGGRQSRPAVRKAHLETAGFGEEKTSFLLAKSGGFLCPEAFLRPFSHQAHTSLFAVSPTFAGMGAGNEIPCRRVSGAAEAPEKPPKSMPPIYHQLLSIYARYTINMIK